MQGNAVTEVTAFLFVRGAGALLRMSSYDKGK